MLVRHTAGMRRAVSVALAVAVALGWAATAATALGPPLVAYDTNAGAVRTAALDGTVASSVANRSPYLSLSGGVLASARPTASGGSKVIGTDAVTGAALFTINDAFFPLIAGHGSRVVFLPDGNASGPGDRDPTLNSVWYRDVASAKEHRLVRFTDSDRIPLNLAASPNGRLAAVTQGNDQDLFQWDIWTARTDVHRVRRLTTDGMSIYPSFSPAGTKIAFTKKDGMKACSGSIWIMDTDGTHVHRVVAARCARVLLRPVWLDAHTLVAWSWGTHGVKGLVKIALPSGAVTPLVPGKVFDYSVSRALGTMAVRFLDGSISLYDISSGTLTAMPGAEPKGARVFLSGALELAY